jgi:hypothetical protein
LSRDLDKVEPTASRDAKTGRLVPSGGKKAAALADAGISTSTAHRCSAQRNVERRSQRWEVTGSAPSDLY